MAKDVLCEVNSCKYWAAGNNCNASSIYVVNNRSKQASNSEEQTARRSSPKFKRARRAALSEKAALVLLCL